MTVKLSGAQWNEFCHDHWTDDQWIDDEDITINGILTPDPVGIEDTDQVTVTGGEIKGWSQDGQIVLVLHSFEHFLRKWLKKQAMASLSVTCPKNKVKEVTAAINAVGGKVK